MTRYRRWTSYQAWRRWRYCKHRGLPWMMIANAGGTQEYFMVIES